LPSWTTTPETKVGNFVLGLFEVALAYRAFFFSKPEVVAAYFAFKVAAKWDTWAHVIKVPDKLDNFSDTAYLGIRNRWGSSVLQWFLLGTLANVVIGFVGGMIYRP
jgi:hypothetical protein